MISISHRWSGTEQKRSASSMVSSLLNEFMVTMDSYFFLLTFNPNTTYEIRLDFTVAFLLEYVKENYIELCVVSICVVASCSVM